MTGIELAANLASMPVFLYLFKEKAELLEFISDTSHNVIQFPSILSKIV